MQSTLVLNASYEPLDTVSARRAIALIRAGKAVSVADSPRVFRSATDELNVPYVVQLKNYVNKSFRRRPQFSRHGMLVRDNYTCVYCGEYGDTIDHVYPRDLGGKNSYENCVTACKRCNHKKANKTLAQLGWSLNFTPGPPSWNSMLLHKGSADEETRQVWIEHIAAYDPKFALSLV